MSSKSYGRLDFSAILGGRNGTYAFRILHVWFTGFQNADIDSLLDVSSFLVGLTPRSAIFRTPGPEALALEVLSLPLFLRPPVAHHTPPTALGAPVCLR